MRKLAALLAIMAGSPALAQGTELAPGIELPAGVVVEARVDGDLNRDGAADIAYLAHTESSRALTVLLSVDGSGQYQPEVPARCLDPG